MTILTLLVSGGIPQKTVLKHYSVSSNRVLMLVADTSFKSDDPRAVDGVAPTGYGAALYEQLKSIEFYDRWWLKVVSDSFLRIEHALLLQHCDLAIFVTPHAVLPGGSQDDGDAPDDIAAERTHIFTELEPPLHHHLEASNGIVTPPDLLHALRTLGRDATMPVCFQLSVSVDIAPGASSSPLASATAFLGELLADPDPKRWRTHLTGSDSRTTLTATEDQ